MDGAFAFAYQVSTKVSQYVMRHDTSSRRAGNQMPLAASSSVAALDAKSIGTSSTMKAGSHSAKNIGTRMYAGVVRRGR